MKKKALAVLMMIPVLGLVAGIIFYALQMRQSNADLKAALDRMAATKLVNVDFAVAVPSDTPKDQAIYLSGSGPTLGNWDSAGVPLERGDDGKWHTSAQVRTDTVYTYKITRGTWGTVETDEKGAARPDRSLVVPAAQAVDVNVAEWVDKGQAVPGRVTLTGDIRVLKNFKSKLLGNQRTVIVYLPPGYQQDSSQRYPVIYMQDGQNLFDESTSYAGVEWKMDEAAQDLITSGKTVPFIIVGIYNTPDRTGEYTPPDLAKDDLAIDGTPARGELYGRFIVEGLKPWIDQTYRTQPDREHTAIGGAALGGTIAMYITKTHNDVFGQVIALSPFLRQGDRKMTTDWLGDGKWLHGTRVYTDMGLAPANNGNNYPGGNDAAAEDGKDLAKALTSTGLQPGKDFVYRDLPEGHDDEASWQGEIGGVLGWMYGR
jgi:enterochelin esterase-like enzyme